MEKMDKDTGTDMGIGLTAQIRPVPVPAFYYVKKKIGIIFFLV